MNQSEIHGSRSNLDYQHWVVETELVRKWRDRTAIPARTKFSKTPMTDGDRRKIFFQESLDNKLLDCVELQDIEINGNERVTIDRTLATIPGMKELAFLQRMEFPFKGHYVVLYRSTRFPTPERIKSLAERGVIGNFGQSRLKTLYENAQYREERQRVISSSHLAAAIMPQERIVKGLPVFFSVLDAIGVHGEFRDNDLDQVIITAFAIPLDVLKGEVKLIYNPPVVIDHDDVSHDREITKFRQHWLGMDKNSLSYRTYPDSNYYRQVYGLQLYEAYLQGLPRERIPLQDLGIQMRHLLVDLYGIETKVDSHRDVVEINGQEIRGNVVFNHRDFLFGFTGGMDALGLERNPSQHLPFRLQELKLKKT